MRFLIVVALLAFMAVGLANARPAEDEQESSIQENSGEDSSNNSSEENTNASEEGSANEESQDSGNSGNGQGPIRKAWSTYNPRQAPFP